LTVFQKRNLDVIAHDLPGQQGIPALIIGRRRSPEIGAADATLGPDIKGLEMGKSRTAA